MKKFIITILLFLLSFAAFPQAGLETDTLWLREADGRLYRLLTSTGGINDTLWINDLTLISSTNALINPVDSILFKNLYSDLNHTEGKLYYDVGRRIMIFMNDEQDISLDLGLELWLEIKNGNGETFNDGKLVYITGSDNGRPMVMLADNRDFVAVDAIGMLTHDVETGTFGFTTTYGITHGIPTPGETEGDRVYVGQNGDWTTSKPIFPNFEYEIGYIAVAHVSEGEIFINPKGQIDDIYHNIHNGNAVEPFDFTIFSDGAITYGALKRSDDSTTLSIRWSEGLYKFPVPDTITLTPGTDGNPVTGYVYIDQATKTLQTIGTYFPLDEEIKTIAKTKLQSSATTQIRGALGNQNYNDYVANTATLQGRISQQGKWTRLRPAKFITGVIGSIDIVNVSGLDSVKLSVTSGIISQANEQAFPGLDMLTGEDIHVPNYFGDPWMTTTNLANLLTDATGATMAGRSFTIVTWIIQNKTGEPSHLVANVPIGSYANSGDAIDDPLNKNVYDIPYDMQSYTIFCVEFTITHTNPGGGTWTLDNTKIITHLTPGAGGSGLSGGTGITAVIQATDYPNSYDLQGGKYLVVNDLETATEFRATGEVRDDSDTLISGDNAYEYILATSIPLTQRAAALGVATLDAGTKIPIAQIPDALIGAVVYQGTWNANTNVPVLASGVGSKGYYYTVTVAGNTVLDGVGNWKEGDMPIYNGTAWEKIDNNHDVISVNGATGTVVLTQDGVGDGTTYVRTENNFTDQNVTDLANNTTDRHVAVTIGTANGLSLATQALSLQLATSIQPGALSAADWITFNAKQAALTPAALTKSNDTNVTLTLGGTPGTSLLQATSLTLGWTGLLAEARGGTGLSSIATLLNTNNTLNTVLTNGNTSALAITVGAFTATGNVMIGTSDAAARLLHLKTTSGHLYMRLETTDASTSTWDLLALTDGSFAIEKAGVGQAYSINGSMNHDFKAGNMVTTGDFSAATLNATNTTTGFFPYDNGTSLVNSIVQQSGTSLGINISPARLLHAYTASGHAYFRLETAGGSTSTWDLLALSDGKFAIELAGVGQAYAIDGSMNHDFKSGTALFGNTITAPTIKLTTGATNGYYLRSDVSGNATWQPITASQVYKGALDGSTGTPIAGGGALIDGTGTSGDWYAASITGTYDYGNPSGNSITLAIGGQLIYNGSAWEEIPTATGVTSVNALTGAVTLYPELSGNLINIRGNATTIDISGATAITANTAKLTANTVNVTAAGALMDSEVDADIKTLVLPASTTISTFGASLVDDAASSNARATLGLIIGTDVQAFNSTLATVANSTYTGDNNITTLGTIATGIWNAGQVTTINAIQSMQLSEGVQLGHTYVNEATDSWIEFITSDGSNNGFKWFMDASEGTFALSRDWSSVSDVFSVAISTGKTTFNNDVDFSTITAGTWNGTVIGDAYVTKTGIWAGSFNGTTVAGTTGTFSGDITVSDEAYGAGWNASTEVPTKNAVYDKFESLITSATFTDVTVTNDLTVDNFIITIPENLAATTTTATPVITKSLVVVTNTVNDYSVHLPSAVAGMSITIVNNSSFTLRVYAYAGDILQDNGGLDYFTISGNRSTTVFAASSSLWVNPEQAW